MEISLTAVLRPTESHSDGLQSEHKQDVDFAFDTCPDHTSRTTSVRHFRHECCSAPTIRGEGNKRIGS